MWFHTRYATNGPLVRTLGLARCHDVFHWLGFEVEASVPVAGYILDELERIHEALVVFGEIGGHLQRAVKRHVEGKLSADGRIAVAAAGTFHLEDTWRVVHRTTLQTREGNDGGVSRRKSAEGLVLGAAGALVANQVGPGAAQTCGSYSLVGIYHDVVVGGTFDGMLVVVDFNLAVMVFATWDDVAHISAFHGIVSIVTHELVGTIHVLLVVHYRRRGLVVHDEFHASAMRIVVERLDVEVGIGCKEVEDLFLGVSAPVLPADVPAFDEHGIEPVVGGKVDVPTYVGIVGAMFARRCCLGIIGQSKFHRWIVVGICPFAFARNHLPPHADILHRMYPTGILDLARLVEVEDKVRGQYLAGIVGDEGGTPRRNQRSLQPSLLAKSVGGEP